MLVYKKRKEKEIEPGTFGWVDTKWPISNQASSFSLFCRHI